MDDLHAYLGGIARGVECAPICIGGVPDHVHLLLRMGRKISLADLVRDLKSNSSAWMKSRCPEFAWHGGYAAFSFAEADLPKMRSYVCSQKEHHQFVSFQDELRCILRESGLEWDEWYLWD